MVKFVMILDTFLICDDIRTEIGNKHTLVGVYDDSIEFGTSNENSNQWPKATKIGFFIRVLLEESHPYFFTLEATLNDETEKIGDGKFEGLPEQIKKINLAMVYPNFVFKSSGEMKFTLSFYDKNNNLISVLSPQNPFYIKEKAIK